MFRNKNETLYDEAGNILLRQGCSFDGKLTFDGTEQINGHFTGEIFSEGTLIVGKEALIEARLEVGSIVIYGKVYGEIVAQDRIELHCPAEVRGNITAKTLVIEEGTFFEGNCQMGASLVTRRALGPVSHDHDTGDDEMEEESFG